MTSSDLVWKDLMEELRLAEHFSPWADEGEAQREDLEDPTRMPLSAREFVIGASCALNMLQVHAGVGPDRQGLSCNSKSSRATDIAEKLSSSAEALCRSTREVVAICFEMGGAYMAVSTQDERFGKKVTIGEVRLGADEGELRPTSQNIKEMMKKLAEEDDIPNILNNIPNGWPYSRALKIAIIQMTQAEHGMGHELIPLENHIEVVQRFLQIMLQTDKTVYAELCRAQQQRVGRIGVRVVAVMQKVDDKEYFWDDDQLIRELREISHGLSEGLISIPDEGSEREGEYYKVPQNAEEAAGRVRTAADKLEGKLAVLRRFDHQVQMWWASLGHEEQEDFWSSMQKGRADASKFATYMRFLHLLFTSSRAVLLLCIERLSAVLDVAPWADKVTMKTYNILRGGALDALREVCTAWHFLMLQKKTVAYWAKLASTLTSGEDAKTILDDCFSIGNWFRTHVHLLSSMQQLKLVQRGKPLDIAVIHNESDGHVREGQARRYAAKVLKSLVGEFAPSDVYGYDARTLKRLKTLFDKTKEGADLTWWPGGKQTDLAVRVQPHCEAILCAHWVSRQNGVKKAWKLPLFGGTRPLCGTCTSYVRNSLREFGVDRDACDRRVAGHHDAYWTCCMPAEAKEDVVQEVAEDLKVKLRDYLRKWEVQEFLEYLALGLDD